MLNQIANVKPLPVPRTNGHAQRHGEQLLELIGDGSDADEVLRLFRAMWPEVEGADGAGSSVSPAGSAGLAALMSRK